MKTRITEQTKHTRATYTVEEVSEMLGVIPQHIRKLIKDGELPGFKLGGRWFIIKEELDAKLKLSRG